MKTNIFYKFFMTEHIIVYHESDFSSPIVVERAEFYQNRLTLYREYFISTVDAFIFTFDGKMILQKRGPNVKISPGRLHTAVGGHINPQEAVSFTLLHECIEEFGAPSYIMPESMSMNQILDTLHEYREKIIVVKPLCFWEMDHVRSDEFSSIFKREKRHDFVGVFGGEPKNLDDSVESFHMMTLEEVDARIAENGDDFTNSFLFTYQKLRTELFAFRTEILLVSEKYTMNKKTEHQPDWDCTQKPKDTIRTLIFNAMFMGKDMSKDACCMGMGKWFCPSISGVVAGVIVIFAGLTKFLGGKAFLTAVGGMVLGLVHIKGHSQIALALGGIAATIEVLGGLSFAIGCRKTSRYAALALSVVMAFAFLVKLQNHMPLQGGMFRKVASLLEQTRIDLLLLAVFFQKGIKVIMSCCGMSCGSCCSMDPKKK